MPCVAVGNVESLGIGEPISIRGIVAILVRLVPRNNWRIKIHVMQTRASPRRTGRPDEASMVTTQAMTGKSTSVGRRGGKG